MSDTPLPKEQQTAYQRWEMSSFSAPEDESTPFNQKKTKSASGGSTKVSQVLEGVRKEAYAKGAQEGFAVGMSKAKEVLTQQQQAFAALASSFESALELADEKIEENILALALDLAKAMLKTKINVDEKAILPIVTEAIHYLPTVIKPARILVHHEDAHMLREYLAEELSEQVWQIQEDNTIERGGCLVETGENKIDATNATRWKRIAGALAQSNDWLQP